MKIKQVLAVAVLSLGLGFLAAPRPVTAATQENIDELIQKVMQEGKELPGTPSRHSKYLEKSKELDENTERRVYFTVDFFQTGEYDFIEHVTLIVEDWKKVRNLKCEYEGRDQIFPVGYVINRTSIEDELWDGTADVCTKSEIVKVHDGATIIKYNIQNINLENPTNREETQRIYDEYVEELLGSIEKTT